jgi:transposase
MTQILAAKLKLDATPDQFRAMPQTQLAYRDALCAVSRRAFAHGEMSDQQALEQALQQARYDDSRRAHGLPAQMACNVPRQGAATYKTLWTNAKANAARQASRAKRRYKGLNHVPKHVFLTSTFNCPRDFSSPSGQRDGVLTLGGRVVLSNTGYTKHVARTEYDAQIGAAELWYGKPHKRSYLLVSLEAEGKDATPERLPAVVGVDVDHRYLAVATDVLARTMFYRGTSVQAQADHSARLRKRLRLKGARSVTRRLMVVSGRERWLKQDRNHLVSRRIVDAYPHALLGLVDLAHRGKRTRARGRHGRKASQKQRRAIRRASQRAFAEPAGYGASRAALMGRKAVRVDGYPTRQAWPSCGYASEDNRSGKGLLFVCQTCHPKLHADLVGARYVALRTLLARYGRVSTGVLSERPEVSCDIAKVAQRRRYSDFGRSLGASPVP